MPVPLPGRARLPPVADEATGLAEGSRRFLPRARFDDLLAALAANGRRVVGPVVADGAIVFADVATAASLPQGWTLRTAPGRARLERLPAGPGAQRTFAYPVAAASPPVIPSEPRPSPAPLPTLDAGALEYHPATIVDVRAAPPRAPFQPAAAPPRARPPCGRPASGASALRPPRLGRLATALDALPRRPTPIRAVRMT
ncbi:MAG: hypothetical protein HYX57_10330 [Chloroflexi bacterium]|nr:hypothetical protein [Chloroflexota bacterium]